MGSDDLQGTLVPTSRGFGTQVCRYSSLTLAMRPRSISVSGANVRPSNARQHWWSISSMAAFRLR